MAIFDHKRLVNEPNRGSVLQLYLIRLTVVLCGSNGGSKMVKFGQIWKWSYSKHVYQIPYAVCETAWEPSESPYGPDLDRVNYGPRNNSGEVDQLIFWQPKICAVKTQNSADWLFTIKNLRGRNSKFSQNFFMAILTQKIPIWQQRFELEEFFSSEYLWCLLRSKMKRY